MTAPDMRAILERTLRQRYGFRLGTRFDDSPRWSEDADACLAALEAAGLVICAEQVGWWRENTAAHAGAWIPLAIEPNQPRDYVPVYIPLSARPEE